MHKITKSKLKQIIEEELHELLNEDWRLQRRFQRPKVDSYRSELMQHLMDQEGMDADEASWAAGEMDSGRAIGLESGIKYTPDTHFADTYDDWHSKPVDVDPTIKPPDTSSISPQNRRWYGSDIHPYTKTEVTESLSK